MAETKKPGFIGRLFGSKKPKGQQCHCKEIDGKWYCYIWDGGQETECPSQGPFDTKEECEQARCSN